MIKAIGMIALFAALLGAELTSASETDRDKTKRSQETRRIWKDEVFKSEIKRGRDEARDDRALPDGCRQSKDCLILAARRRLILENEKYAMQEAMRSCRRKRKAIDSNPEKFDQYKKECRTSVKNMKKKGDQEAIVRLALEDPIETVAFRELGGIAEPQIAQCMRARADGTLDCPAAATESSRTETLKNAPITASTDPLQSGSGAY